MSEQKKMPRWCPLCPTNGYHKPENCPERSETEKRPEAGKR